MKLKKLLLTPLILALILIPSLCLPYDQVKPDPVPITTDFSSEFSYVRIRALGTAIGLVWDWEARMYVLKEGFFEQGGSGVVVAAGYVLTAAHIINPKTITLPETRSSSRITDVIGRTSRTVLIYDYKDDPITTTVLYENIESDLALLKYNHEKNNWLKPLPYPIEYKVETLMEGDVVVAVVHDRDSDDNMEYNVLLRWGTIVKPGPYGFSDEIVAWLTPWDITLNLAIQDGDSGSPLFVFRDGKPILIGIMRAYTFEVYGYYSYAVQLPVVWKILKGRR